MIGLNPDLTPANHVIEAAGSSNFERFYPLAIYAVTKGIVASGYSDQVEPFVEKLREAEHIPDHFVEVLSFWVSKQL